MIGMQKSSLNSIKLKSSYLYGLQCSWLSGIGLDIQSIFVSFAYIVYDVFVDPWQFDDVTGLPCLIHPYQLHFQSVSIRGYR